MQLSIIIPAYNEEKRLPLTLQRIFEYLETHFRGSYEVIIVDDGSTDNTVRAIESYRRQYDQLRLFRNLKNQGRGAAVKAGIFKAHGEFILETDADGSVNEHAIIDFLSYFKKDTHVHVLTGSRTLPESRILTAQPFFRKILGYGFFFLTNFFFGWPVVDRINGFKMYRREAALDIFRHSLENRFFAKAEVIFIAEQRGWHVKELPVLWTEHSGSKVRPLLDTIDSLLGLFRLLKRKRNGWYSQNLPSRNRHQTKNGTINLYQVMLLTGGCGFMASNFIRYFYHKYPHTHIVNLDKLTYAGNPENLKDINQEEAEKTSQRYTFVKGDICDEELVEKLFSEYEFDLVVHYAAESHVDRAYLGAAEFIRTNIEGTRVLMDAARKHGIKRFIHISTDEIYGSYSQGLAREGWPIKPTNTYAASKAAADFLVQTYIQEHGLPAVIVRGSNNFGPFQHPEKLVPVVITNLLQKEKVAIHGYGDQIRSMIHVNDFSRAVDLMISKNLSHKVYNIPGEEKTVLEVIQIIAEHLDVDLEKNKFHVATRPGQDSRYAVDGSRLIDDLGWAPDNRQFEDQIKEVIQWYLDHPQWWQPLRTSKDFSEYYKTPSKGHWTDE